MAAEDTRLSIAHMASTLYSQRVENDTRRGQGNLFKRNPDARALYCKGIHDTVLCLEEWMKSELPPKTLAVFLEALHNQTED